MATRDEEVGGEWALFLSVIVAVLMVLALPGGDAHSRKRLEESPDAASAPDAGVDDGYGTSPSGEFASH
jgi:hypothetical protein